MCHIYWEIEACRVRFGHCMGPSEPCSSPRSSRVCGLSPQCPVELSHQTCFPSSWTHALSLHLLFFWLSFLFSLHSFLSPAHKIPPFLSLPISSSSPELGSKMSYFAVTFLVCPCQIWGASRLGTLLVKWVNDWWRPKRKDLDCDGVMNDISKSQNVLKQTWSILFLTKLSGVCCMRSNERVRSWKQGEEI